MYHKQLVTHICSRKALGLSDNDIRIELIQDGWSEEDISLGFHYAQFPEKLNHFSLARALKSEVRASIFVAVLLISVGIGLAFSLYFGTRLRTYNLTIVATPASGKTVFNYGVQPALSNLDFFNSVKNEFIKEKATFVEVNLTQMVARVYINGAPTIQVPVKTKGKIGSWWETPAGLYKIETKEKTHYSSMGHVTQPWSMEFQGNFFIHGWPYYDNGDPVASTFSGGCIRLADEDAQKIFNAVTVGTPILVYEKNFSPDDFSYTEVRPNIQANAFLTADINSNFVFLENNKSQIIAAGAVTKLMTALIATEYINIEKTIRVPKEALASTSVPRLYTGMKIDIYQLLFPLLRESSNEAGEAVALSYGRSQFIDHMNEKAKAIGMTNTVFVDPTGISPENVSTAEDMFMLAKYIYNNRSFIFHITSGKVITNTYGESIFANLGSGNALSSNKLFFGGIADESGTEIQNSLSLFEVPFGTTVRPIFFVSLTSRDAASDANGSLEYLLERYK